MIKLKTAKVDNPNAWLGKTLEQLQDHVATLDLPQNRDTDVYITLYDSYGDGHDGDAYILLKMMMVIMIFGSMMLDTM